MQHSHPNPNYPYYGQPYHYYVPPGYPQAYSAASGGNGTPEQYAPIHKDPNAFRDKHTNMHYYPQPPVQTGNYPATNGLQNQPPIHPPPRSAGHAPFPQTKQPSTNRPGARTPATKTQPLRSAMKKPKRSNSEAHAPLQRTRTNSDARQRLAPMTRTNSNPSYLPDHMFLSFLGTNELRIQNAAFQDTLDDIKEKVLPMWPSGVASQSTVGYSWRVTFSRNPWSASGPDGIIVRRMICELFARLAHQGYQYLCSATSGYPAPQLVFQDVGPDDSADFFVAYFSRSGHRLTLIKPPRHIGETIGLRLRSAWPYKFAAHHVSEDEVYTVELKRNSLGAPELDKNVFASHALQEINMMGFKLVATVPLARSGLLGFGSRKEVWVFRGTQIQPRSRANSRTGRS